MDFIRSRSRNAAKIRVATGNTLINLPLTISTILGSLFPYLISYYHFHQRSNSMPESDLDPTWLLPGYLIFQSVGILLGNAVRRYVGVLRGMVCGLVVLTASRLLSFYSVQHSVWLSGVTLSVVEGLAVGVVQVMNMAHVAVWFTASVGKVSAVVVSSSALGTVVFNAIFNAYINPRNVSPDATVRGMPAFSQLAVVNRVPGFFVIFAATSAAFQIIGFALIADLGAKESSTSKNVNDLTGADGCVRKDKKTHLVDDGDIGDNDSGGHQQKTSCRYGSNVANRNSALRSESEPRTIKASTSIGPYSDVKSPTDSSTFNTNTGIGPNSYVKSLTDSSTLKTNTSIGPNSDVKSPTDSSTFNTNTGIGPNSDVKSPTESPTFNMNTGIGPNSDVKSPTDSSTFKTRDATIKDMLSCPSFYAMWLADATLTFSQIGIFNFFKVFGEERISDDWFLNLVGSLSSCFSIAARLLLGVAVDRFGMQTCLVGIMSTLCLMLAWWVFTPTVSPWLFLVWTDVLMSLVGSRYLLVPLAALRLAGAKRSTMVWGLLQTSSLVGEIASPLLFSLLFGKLSWFWIFMIGSAVSFLSLIITILIMNRGY